MMMNFKAVTCHMYLYILLIIILVSITIAAVSNDVLGEDFSQGTGAWCWISSCIDKNARTLWMVFTGKGWEITWYFVTCIMFFFVKGYMWKQVLQLLFTLVS